MIPVISMAIKWTTKELKKAQDKAKRQVLQKQAKFVRARAKALIQKRKSASAPGDMISGKSGNYKKSIFYKVTRSSAFVGPTQPKGSHAGLLKWGTKTMKPRQVPAVKALEQSRPQLAAMYSGKI